MDWITGEELAEQQEELAGDCARRGVVVEIKN